MVCDAVISDYSSTLFDFSMLAKPAFVCALDYKEYEEKRGFIPEFYEFPFPFATSNNELINVIQKYDEKNIKTILALFIPNIQHIVMAIRQSVYVIGY